MIKTVLHSVLITLIVLMILIILLAMPVTLIMLLTIALIMLVPALVILTSQCVTVLHSSAHQQVCGIALYFYLAVQQCRVTI